MLPEKICDFCTLVVHAEVRLLFCSRVKPDDSYLVTVSVNAHWNRIC